ncbi:MAG: hypothetical protein KDD44_15385, partial [Bdellovibrionales bacterium]|nr:hypothetical protein [Bdellovibrionales bacterium]
MIFSDEEENAMHDELINHLVVRLENGSSAIVLCLNLHLANWLAFKVYQRRPSAFKRNFGRSPASVWSNKASIRFYSLSTSCMSAVDHDPTFERYLDVSVLAHKWTDTERDRLADF